jgi:hypothetical protein
VVAFWALMIPILVSVFLYLWCARLDSSLGRLPYPNYAYSSFPALWPLLVAYMIWVHAIDGAPEHGGRLSPWFRRLRFWQFFADYYPAS